MSGREAYIVNIRHAEGGLFFRLSRKAARCGRLYSAPRLTVSSVVPDGSEQMRCITVSHPSSLYVTLDLIVTHNSSVALQFAMNAAPAGHGVGIASLEMTETQIADRAIAEAAARAGHPIAYRDFRTSFNMSEDDWQHMIDGARALQGLPIEIIPPQTRTAGAILSACRRIERAFEKRKARLALLIVDYLQIMQAAGRSSNGNERVTELSGSIKSFAMRLGVPVVVLSQLSRQVEMREEKRPMLADLRESGAIEQDADIVIFPFREEYYLARSRPTGGGDALAEWQSRMARVAGRIELIVAKQRMGPIGVAGALFDYRSNWLRDVPAWERAEAGAPGAQTEGFA